MSPISIILLSPMKKLSCLNRERNMHSLQAKTVQSCYGLWTRIFPRSDDLKLKRLNDIFVSYKHMAFSFKRHYLMNWLLLWCFYQLFGLSLWRHPFTAKHPLLSKWCNATFLQIWRRNKLIYVLDGVWLTTFPANINFWVNYSFNDRNNPPHFKKPCQGALWFKQDIFLRLSVF